MVEKLPVGMFRTQPNCHVKVTVYHGEKPLCPPFSTKAHLLEGKVYLNEVVQFDIQQKNLPKVLTCHC